MFTSRLTLLAVLSCLGLCPPWAMAQSEAGEVISAQDPDGGDASPDPQPQQVSGNARKPLKAIVRGLYLEARPGVSATVLNAEVVTPDPFNPGISGKQGKGVGAAVFLSLGYDVNESVAIELIGGGTMVSGDRRDQVRDLSVLVAGAGARLSFSLGERLRLVAAPGVALVQASTVVDSADTGFGALIRGGLEYYVHVRHFSVGFEVLALTAFSPTRVLIGATPTIKYTF